MVDAKMTNWNVCGLKLSAFGVMVITFGGSVRAEQIQVPRDYPTIQDAIIAASEGDEVLVEPGLYPEHINTLGKGIVLRGIGGAAATIVIPRPGQSLPLITCASQESAETIIDGFQFFGCAYSAASVVSASPVFRNCRFIQNVALNGGGVAVSGASSEVRFEDCEFFGNIAGNAGGAVHISATSGSVVFGRCRFESNEADGGPGGGAIATTGTSGLSVSLTDCALRANWAAASGGAIYCQAGQVRVVDCVVDGNGCAISGGGAIYSVSTVVTVETSSLTSNYVATGGASEKGGGAIRAGGSLQVEACHFEGNSVAVSSAGCSSSNAYGGAIDSHSDLIVRASTFSGNSVAAGASCGSARANGGALSLLGTTPAVIEACTFANSHAQSSTGGASARGGAIYVGSPASAHVRGCEFLGNAAGPGDGDGGAVWMETTASSFSDCSFAGSTASDDGGALFLSGGGATFVRCTVSDGSAAGDGGGAYCASGGTIFSECRFSGNSSTSGGALYSTNARPFLERCVLDGNTASSGTAIRAIGTGIELTPSVQFSHLCGPDALVVGNWTQPVAGSNTLDSSCDPDCNSNGVVDLVDISRGYEVDCDADGTPDSCQIASGAPDLNGDGVLDSCDSNDYMGLRTVIVPIIGRSLDQSIPSSALCYRIYAEFAGPSGAVWGVYGNDAHPMVFVASGGFYNSVAAGDLSSEVSCELDALPYGTRYDSWLTIGAECLGANALQSIGFEAGSFGSSGFFDDDALVFVVPESSQGEAGKSRRVLLAQVTTNDGSLPVGSLNVLGRASDGVEFVRLGQVWPAPELVDCDGNGIHDAFDLRDGVWEDCDESGVPDICESSSASADCNANGVSDYCDIANGASIDQNRNNVPDECECEGDVDGDGTVNVDDVVAVILAWGDTGPNPADLNGDFVVDAGDLSLILTYYGTCQ